MRSLANEAKRGVLMAIAALAVCVAALALMASPARAADFMVTNTNDSGAGSLREAVGFANANAEADTITFDLPANSVVTLSSQIEFTASQKTTVDGGGGVTVSGGGATRVFQVSSGANVSIKRLTVSDCRTFGIDGGIRNNNGALSVVDSAVSGNNALDNGNQPSSGGGIRNAGPVPHSVGSALVWMDPDVYNGRSFVTGIRQFSAVGHLPVARLPNCTYGLVPTWLPTQT